MRRKLMIVMIFSSLLLTMCSALANETTYTNGLSCKNYSDGTANCSYVCPDGSVKQVNIPDTISPLYAATEAELDEQICGVALQSTPTEPLATATSPASPTPEVTATEAIPPPVESTLTAVISVTGNEVAVLTGRVLMCDLGANLINFRLAQPALDLTDKSLAVQIADTESMCYVNPTNPTLLTCTIPAAMTFPARVVVSLDGTIVNDFTYSGLGCEELTTPLPPTTP